MQTQIQVQKRTGSKIIFILLMSSFILLSGCDDKQKKVSELQDFMDEVKQRPVRQVEPIPDVKPHKPHDYSAENLRSPFQPPTIAVEEGGLRPDLDREKEILESFPLDALRMVGTIHRNNRVWALVSAPDGVVYRITVGGHLGKNYGKVLKISKDKISIEETVPNELGGWKTRDASLTLVEK